MKKLFKISDADFKGDDHEALREFALLYDSRVADLHDKEGVLRVRSPANDSSLFIKSLWTINAPPEDINFQIVKQDAGVIGEARKSVIYITVRPHNNDRTYCIKAKGNESVDYDTKDLFIGFDKAKEKVTRWMNEVAGPQLVMAIEKEITSHRAPWKAPRTAARLLSKKLTGRPAFK